MSQFPPPADRPEAAVQFLQRMPTHRGSPISAVSPPPPSSPIPPRLERERKEEADGYENTMPPNLPLQNPAMATRATDVEEESRTS